MIPCYVEGPPYDGTALGSFFMAAKARVVMGQPIDLSQYYDREGDKTVLPELTKTFLREIARLAGHPNYEPKAVGRNGKWNLDDAEGNGSAETVDAGTSATAGHA